MRMTPIALVTCLIIISQAIAEESPSTLDTPGTITELKTSDFTAWDSLRTSRLPDLTCRRILFEQQYSSQQSAWAVLTARAIRLKTPVSAVIASLEFTKSNEVFLVTHERVKELWKEELKAIAMIAKSDLPKPDDLLTLVKDLRYRASMLAVIGGRIKADVDTAKLRASAASLAHSLADYTESLAQSYYKNELPLEAVQLQLLAIDYQLIRWGLIDNAKLAGNRDSNRHNAPEIDVLLAADTRSRYYDYLRKAKRTAFSRELLNRMDELHMEYERAVFRADRDADCNIGRAGISSKLRADVTLLDTLVAVGMGKSPKLILHRHGLPNIGLKDEAAKLIGDAGIRFVSWNENGKEDVVEFAKQLKSLRKQNINFAEDGQQRFEQLIDDLLESEKRARNYPVLPGNDLIK